MWNSPFPSEVLHDFKQKVISSDSLSEEALGAVLERRGGKHFCSNFILAAATEQIKPHVKAES